MTRVLSIILVFQLSLFTVSAGQREVLFPIDNFGTVATTRAHTFAHNGNIGYTLILKDSMLFLYSFSVPEGRAVSFIDLTADFGTIGGNLSLRAHNETGLILAFGVEPMGRQKVVALSSDAAGHVTKLWSSVYSGGGLKQLPDVRFSLDGSRVYVFFNDAGGTSLAMLRSEDGQTISTFKLTASVSTGSIIFDDIRNRPIVISAQSVYLFMAGSDSLVLESVIPQSFLGAGVDAPALSQDGRYLITYGGYALPERYNAFSVYDLEQKTERVLTLEGKFLPSVPSLIFNRPTGSLLIPYSEKVTSDGRGTYFFVDGKSRSIDTLSLSANGALARTVTVTLPKNSPGTVNPNIISQANHVDFSSSGAMGFVSTANGHIFTFDTLTGEVINDQTIGNSFLSFIHLVEPLNMLVGVGLGRIFIVDVNTHPVIASVQVSKKRTLLTGGNFLSGAHVFVNGEDVGIAERNVDSPGKELLLTRGNKQLPSGVDLVFEVRNRDGLKSAPFIVERD